LLCAKLEMNYEGLHQSVNHARENEKQIRDALRQRGFVAVAKGYLSLAEGEQSHAIRRRYLDRARIAKSMVMLRRREIKNNV
jgi:hypothetical protein